mmetsp:Transcript_9880/g.25442  ORF Transcript_9880/g.25442 Transcript_9880/m.25442 type:complete len:474 (-) Transcript_9880:179-1600(-)
MAATSTWSPSCSSLRRPCPLSLVPGRPARSWRVAASSTSASQPSLDKEADFVIVGAGIMGLSIARALLETERKPRVVVLEQQRQLCSGATGAGQGYLWLAHRDPASPMWQLAARSKELWLELQDGEGAWEEAEWQRTGSLLLASSSQEAAELAARTACLEEAGVKAHILEPSALMELEPALRVPAEGAGMLVETDAQLNGRNAAFMLLSLCRSLARKSGGEFECSFEEGVAALERSEDGKVCGALTSRGRRLTASRGVVMAAGAWAGDFLAEQLEDSRWEGVIAPRGGQLLILPPPEGMPKLQRGVMEMSYSKHYKRLQEGAQQGDKDALSQPDITFTATAAASGELLLGSSRQFGGFDTSQDMQVTTAILSRAAEFLPALTATAAAAKAQAQAGSSEWSGGLVRTGPRPWAAGGLPFVGPVAGEPRLFIAAGHEGSGLTLAPVTAEIMAGYLYGGGTDVPGAECLLPETLLK